MKIRSVTLAALIAGLALQVSAFASSGGSEASGVPNPSTANCVQKGGRSNLAESQTGQLGVCSFGRAGIEEWTLFKFKAPSSVPMAVAAYLKHPTFSYHSGNGQIGMPNPSFAYCSQLGGQSLIVSDVMTKMQYGLCEFNDHSAIEMWTLLTGPSAPQNQQLNQVLGVK